MATSPRALPSFAAAIGPNSPTMPTSWMRCAPMVKGRTATLVTATREVDFSHAEVLRRILQRK
jgi:hypothetical protein